MRVFVTGHRALLGICGLIALIALFVSLAGPTTPTARELALAVIAFAGLGALVGSPYWKIVYREAPLRAAAGLPSDLDEREHGLRDRAHGLSYHLFATINVLLLALAWVLLDLGKIQLDGDKLRAAIIPYTFFAASLPVILLEWFQPSGPAPAGLELDEE